VYWVVHLADKLEQHLVVLKVELKDKRMADVKENRKAELKVVVTDHAWVVVMVLMKVEYLAELSATL
jgi:hypothetical protein